MSKLFILVICICIICVFSCEKDNPMGSSSNNNSSGYRIKKVTVSDDGELNSIYKFTYQDEKVQLIEDSNFYNMKDTKTEFHYDANFVNEFEYEKIDNEWILQSKRITTFNGNFIVDEIINHLYDDGWRETFRGVYEYENDKLISYKHYTGGEEPCLEAELIYQNGKLIQINEDGGGYLEKTLLNYKNDKLQNYIIQWSRGDLIFENDKKIIYSYSNNRIIVATIYDWENESWEEWNVINYKYDQIGLLKEKLYSDGDKYSYEYEKGNGNAHLFWDWYDSHRNWIGEPDFQ